MTPLDKTGIEPGNQMHIVLSPQAGNPVSLMTTNHKSLM
jgi:hypothetical protein